MSLFTKYLKWALKYASVILMTPLVNFNVKLPDLAKFASKLTADGFLSDEDLAALLSYIEQQIH